MASGNSGYFDLTGNYGASLRVHWSETYDIETNQSVVTISKLQVMSSWYSGVTYYLDGSISVNNSVVVNMSSSGGTNPVTIAALDSFYDVGGTLGAVSGITHDDDGSGQTTISVSVKGYTQSGGAGSGWAVSGTHDITLATIPRKSTVSASNGTLGVAQKLTVTKKADSFTHTINYSCGTASGTICTKSSATSITWIPPIELASQNTTGTSVAIKLTITTYSGSTSIGSNSISITCKIPASVAPSCSLSVTDATGLDATYGAMVKGYSKMAIAITATKAYGSAISTYQITANGSVYNVQSVTTGVLKSSGTLSVTATVVDQRGRAGTATESVSVLNYTAPVVTLLKVNRCDEDGTANESGEFVQVTFSGTVTALNNKNTATYKLEYKKTTASSYTAVTLTDLANNYSVSNSTYIFAADSGSSYNVRLTITDDLSNGKRLTVASTGDTIMHFRASGKGMGIGKVGEADNTLDMGWKIQMNGNRINGFIDMGTYEGSINNISNTGLKLNSVVWVTPNTTYLPLSGTGVYGILETWAVSGSIWMQRLNYASGSVCHRMYYNSAWQSWIWDHPPMVAGVEYRTADRINGKDVYTQAFSFGTLPNTTTKKVEHGIANISSIVDYSLYSSSNGTANFVGHGNVTSIIATASYIQVTTNYNLSGTSAMAVLRYTKTT